MDTRVELSDEQIEQALASLGKAHHVVCALCSGEARWTMSVPARPTSDPDLVIAAAIREAETAIRQLKEQRDEAIERIDLLYEERAAYTDLADEYLWTISSLRPQLEAKREEAEVGGLWLALYDAEQRLAERQQAIELIESSLQKIIDKRTAERGEARRERDTLADMIQQALVAWENSSAGDGETVAQ